MQATQNIYYHYMCVYTYMCASHTCEVRWQKAFSPFTFTVPGVELRSLGFAGQALYPLTHLSGPAVFCPCKFDFLYKWFVFVLLTKNFPKPYGSCLSNSEVSNICFDSCTIEKWHRTNLMLWAAVSWQNFLSLVNQCLFWGYPG